MTRQTKAPCQCDADTGADVVIDQKTHPEHTSTRYASQAAWRRRNPIKHWAHVATQSGLRRGLITPEPCEVCGAEKAEAHHDDYDRPLAVRWLCRKHHREVHYPPKTGDAL